MRSLAQIRDLDVRSWLTELTEWRGSWLTRISSRSSGRVAKPDKRQVSFAYGNGCRNLWRSSKVTRVCLPRLPTKTERSELTHSFAGFKQDSLGSVTDLSLRVIPIGHQVLLVESLDEIRTNFFIEQSPEQQIGPVDHIDHKRLHLLIARTREF